MNLIWHYTSNFHLEKILKSQTLKVSEAERLYGLKPAVWFSKNSIWEPTATKMIFNGIKVILLTPEEQLSMIGMMRIAIEYNSSLISWAKYKYVSKIPISLYNDMEKAGKEKGAKPSDWYCSFKNIPSSQWKSIETYDGQNWLLYQGKVSHPSVINP